MTVESGRWPPFVFICHSHDRSEYARRLEEHLKARGVDAWLDTKVHQGDLWEPELAARIDGCTAVVVLMSEGAEQRPWVQREIERALGNKKKIFPLLLDGQDFERLSRLQRHKVPDGQMPNDAWVARVRDYLSKPLKVVEPFEKGKPRRWAAVAAVTAVLAVATALTFIVLSQGSDPGGGVVSSSATPGAGPCEGRAAHIDRVSSESAGHTGYTPRITFTICAAAAPDEEYWIMDYTQENRSQKTFYNKGQLDGTTGTRQVIVTHTPATTVGSSRHYLILAAPRSLHDKVTSWTLNDDEVPVVGPDTPAPLGLRVISNEVFATL